MKQRAVRGLEKPKDTGIGKFMSAISKCAHDVKPTVLGGMRKTEWIHLWPCWFFVLLILFALLEINQSIKINQCGHEVTIEVTFDFDLAED